MLLIEHPILFKLTNQQIRENIDSTKNGNLFLNNVLIITASEKNGNGRYYPKPLWEREIEKFGKKIQEGTTETCGELDHPESEIINLKNASHCFRKIWWDNNDVKANIEVFCSPGLEGNPSGRILGSFLKNGLAVGFSTRGTGTLKQVGEIMEVQDDFTYTTTDAVSNPSNFGSWSKLRENKNNSTIIAPYYNINSIITEILCSNGRCPVLK